MPEYVFEPLHLTNPVYEVHVQRTGLVIAGYALAGRYNRFYYGATDDLELLEGQMRKIMIARGAPRNFMTRPSCTIGPADKLFQASINLFYPAETHTLSFLTPGNLEPTAVMHRIDAVTVRMEILKRQLLAGSGAKLVV